MKPKKPIKNPGVLLYLGISGVLCYQEKLGETTILAETRT